MLKIGLTGNIGSGKTTVAKLFELLGVPVFYADIHAKQAMVTDQQLISQIRQNFGEKAYADDGTLNRRYIAGIVFNNDDQLVKLNAIVHPAVFRAFDSWLLDINAPYVIKEAAILFESGSYKLCDRSLLVASPLKLRISRVMKRDGITGLEVQTRDARQFTEEKKKQLADDIITNDDIQLVIPQVLQLHQRYLFIAKN